MAPSEKEIREAVEELKTDASANVTDAEASALAAAAACGDETAAAYGDETAAEKFRRLPEEQKARIAPPEGDDTENE